MITCKKLTLEDVKKIAAAAEKHALSNGWNVSIAICDAGGHTLWLQRLDGAPAMSAEVAAGKANASALSGKPTKAVEDMINNGRTAAVNMPVLGLEGGEPIIADGHVIGAIGVSGVQAAQDAEIARSGLATLDLG
ncbi:MAG TPA: heme-binding protein [Burkholderiaceae bacterium]|nr:heme-binding protein [Burkholderiaceae bacterium]